MHRLWPLPAGEVGDDELDELYRYPARPDGSWVAVNTVASIDGAIEIDGRSRALSTPADRRVYRLGSDLADVVLLGAGTAVAEDYPGLRPDATSADRRRRHGLAAVPPLAVVSGGASLPADTTSIVDTLVATIVITCAATAESTRRAWRDAGAEVMVAGQDAVDLQEAIARLASGGLRRVDCEGGPGLVGSLLAADAVDELRVNMVPLAVAGRASRAATTPERLPAPAGFELASVVVEDSTLLLRHVRAR